MRHLINPTDNCVFLICEGSYSLDEATAAWREAQKAVAERAWERVLVDFTTVRSNLNTDELFDLAKLLWRDFPPDGRIALVVRWDQSRLAKLLEMLGRTLGMWLAVFRSDAQAVAWVLDRTPDEPAVAAVTH